MKLLFTLALLGLVSCGHNKTKFESYPTKAQVSLLEKDGNIIDLGSTPLSISNDDLFKGELAQVIFTRQGYKDEKLTLSRPENNTRMNISAKLDRETSADGELFNQRLEKITSQIALIQNHIKNRNFDMAQNIIQKIISDYPDLSVPYDLMGNIYYLQNNRLKALQSYKKADARNPSNTKRKRIMRKISGDF